MTKKVLVKMTKEGEEPIEVSPLVVENHKQLGWKVYGEEPAAAAEVKPAEESEKNSRRRARGKRAAPKESEAVAGDEE